MPEWLSDFYLKSTLFTPITHIAKHFASLTDWPTLANLNEDLKNSPHPHKICFVEQGPKPTCFEQHYEPRIYLRGEIQTRQANWHDYFNMLVWRSFPLIKSMMNRIHYQESVSSQSLQRSQRQNRIAMLDECGMVVVSSAPKILDLIRRFAWHELFWEQRQLLLESTRFVIIGHALYEKALNPYIGMTAMSLLLPLTDTALLSSPIELNHYIDGAIADYLNSFDPKHKLDPVPLLGYPGWHEKTDDVTFYSDHRYFRSGRRQSA